MNRIDMPPSTVRRIEDALAAGVASSGATRLRPVATGPSWRAAAWGTAGLALATLVAVVFIAPMIKKDRGAVSAAEILAASADRLTHPANGIELLEYELVLDGVPKDIMPEHADGTYQVKQVIDHTTPGRFLFASYAPDGSPISSIAQDPATGTRVMAITHEGQTYRFEVTVPPNVGPSLPELERLHMEASIAMMRASGNQVLEVVEGPNGRQYRIEVPKVSAPASNPVWDLSEARILVNANDYRVAELAVKGTFLKQPYSVSYRLISQSIASSVAPDTLDVPHQPGEILMSGDGSVMPARDAMVLTLRELTRLKRQ
jgi:hypothetical protein